MYGMGLVLNPINIKYITKELIPKLNTTWEILSVQPNYLLDIPTKIGTK